MKRTPVFVATPAKIVGLVGVGLVITLLAAPRTALSAQPPAAPAPTVGEFVVRYAEAMKLVPAGATPDLALAALSAANVVDAAGLNLGAALTEGDVVRLTERMKLGIASTNPARTVSHGQVDIFLNVFGPALASGQVGNPRNGSNATSFSAVSSSAGAGPPDNRPPEAADPASKGSGKQTGLSPHFPL